MLLTSTEAALFFKLILPLQFFANRKLGVLPKVKTFAIYCDISLQEKFEVRNALFANPHLLDEFIDENPHDIPLPELAIISTWKKFVPGEFYIERYLKDYAVFISEDERAYAVSGLTTALDESFPKYFLQVEIIANSGNGISCGFSSINSSSK